MDLVSILVAFAAGFIIAWTLKPDAPGTRLPRMPLREAEDITVNRQRSHKKNERKDQIVETVDNSGSITAREVESMFDVSSATATRYLQELKQEGKLKEKGRGRSVHYTL